jgi:hypothetical protein
MKFDRFLKEIRFSRHYLSTPRSIPVLIYYEQTEAGNFRTEECCFGYLGKVLSYCFLFPGFKGLMSVLLNKLELLRGRMASAGDARPHADRVIKRAVCRDLQHPSLPDDACSKERGASGPDGDRASTHAGCGHNRGDAAAGEQLKQKTLRVVSSGNCIIYSELPHFAHAL